MSPLWKTVGGCAELRRNIGNVALPRRLPQGEALHAWYLAGRHPDSPLTAISNRDAVESRFEKSLFLPAPKKIPLREEKGESEWRFVGVSALSFPHLKFKHSQYNLLH